MTIFRGCVLDAVGPSFPGARLRADGDAGIVVRDGLIVDRGGYGEVRKRHPREPVVSLPSGVLLPGLVDTHVHFPQVRIIGALGMPLLEWLERRALPEEARLSDLDYARAVAIEFVDALLNAGTTTALVFGSHFASAVEALFEVSSARGIRITGGLVVSDRRLRPDLLTTSERAYSEGALLAKRWHGDGRIRYAVTPRFAISCSGQLLDACSALHQEVAGSWLTTHLNEQSAEIAEVRQLFGGAGYLQSYREHGLVGPRSVFAHNVHPGQDELDVLAAAGATIAHCPSSNCALGSGLFPMRRHLDAGVSISLGSDVGAGTGFSLFSEGLQAYFVQRLRGGDGVVLTSADLLYLATMSGARALGLSEQVGDLSVGKRFDAVWLRPGPGSALDIGVRHADGPEDALARIFSQAGVHDVACVWVDGVLVRGEGPDGSPRAA
jgi:guanine deaminase